MRLGVLSLVFVAGCSLIWDMDPYEGGRTASREDAGAIGDASSSGGNEAGGACVREVEPNDGAFEEKEVAVGLTCGTVSSPGDIDRFTLTTNAEFLFEVTADPSVRVIYFDANSNDIEWTGDKSDVTARPGRNELMFQTAFGSPGNYTIKR